MFPQAANDIFEQRPVTEPPINLRILKPKLMTSLNYQQEYFIRKKQKRRNRNIHKKFTLRNLDQSINSSYYNQNSSNQTKKNNHLGSTIYQSNLYREVFDGNDKISGYWINGLLEGDAQIQYHNGDYFRGKFERGYKTQGLMIFKDQGTYEGQFLNQQFHGRGVLCLKDKIISAEWVNGLIQGNCVIQYKNKNVYYGPVKQFKRQGYGYLYFPNDTKFFGQFVDGAIIGYGEYFEKGVLKSKGLWKDGQLIQEKKQEDGVYNYEEESVDSSFMEDLFQTKVNNLEAGNGFFEIIITKTHTISEEDDKFKSMLESLKNISKKVGLTQQLPISLKTISIDEKDQL